MSTSVLLVDDHPVVRSGLRAVIDAQPGLSVIGEAADGAEAVAAAARLVPDVVVCDLRLGAGMDGIATAAALRGLPRPPAVLMLTTFDSEADIVAAVRAGAAGYLVKDASPGTICAAISAVARGESYLPTDVALRLMRGMRREDLALTDRENEVLRLLATGASNRVIAKSLFVAEATVKSHLVHIFTKLGVDTRTAAIHVARERGLL